MSDNKASEILEKWREKQIQSGSDLEVAMKGKAISLAYHTNKLEYPDVTYDDTREVFMSGRVSGYSGKVRTLIAIQNARTAWDLFKDSFDDMRPIDETLVKEFHRELTSGTYAEDRYRHGERPGEYKIGDYVTGRYEVGAPPEDVAEEMKELIDELQDVSPGKVLTAAAYFHVKFENIHGFADGNGRTGRLLMNYFLACNDHPIIIIREENKKEYMSALEAWDFSQKLEPMRDLLEESMIKTWEDLV